MDQLQATFRSLLLQQPRRLAVLGGKLLALLVTIAAFLAAAFVVTWLASLAMAGSRTPSRRPARTTMSAPCTAG